MDDCVDESESLVSPRNLRLGRWDFGDVLIVDSEEMKKKEEDSGKKIGDGHEGREEFGVGKQKEEGGLLDQLIRHLPISVAGYPVTSLIFPFR